MFVVLIIPNPYFLDILSTTLIKSQDVILKNGTQWRLTTTDDENITTARKKIDRPILTFMQAQLVAKRRLHPVESSQ